MKHYLLLFISLLALFAWTGCASQKDIAYMQNSATVDLSKSGGLYDLRIIPQDVLNITVVFQDKDISKAFNKQMSTTSNITHSTITQGGSDKNDNDNANDIANITEKIKRYNSGETGYITDTKDSTAEGTNLADPYIVDTNGNIDFPVIGQLHVAGLTESGVKNLIKEKIASYLSNVTTEQPVISCRILNYTISVLGEVRKPGSYQIASEKVNILEALAICGDLTIYGKRNNVKLIRQNAEKGVEVHTIDLTDANFINSPYYYMHQNDVLYIEPNNTMRKESKIGSTTNLWIRGTSISISLAALIASILNN